MSKAVVQFIAVVSIHFKPPTKVGDETAERAWHASMIRQLQHYSPELLARAADYIVTTRHPERDGRWFPAPAECHEYVKQAERLLKHESNPTPLLATAVAKGDPWSTERQNLADIIVTTTPLGKRAAKEGWVMQLWDFIREEQRAPTTNAEFVELQERSKRFDDMIRRLYETDEFGRLTGTLRRFGQTFLDERQRLRARVLGDAA